MAKSQQVKVNETRRQIVFTNGERLDLHNVTTFDPSGTWLRLWSDEGVTILNTKNINFHQIKTDIRQGDKNEEIK